MNYNELLFPPRNRLIVFYTSFIRQVDKGGIVMLKKWKAMIAVGIVLLGWLQMDWALAYVKGIYISQHTAQSSKKMNYLISQSKRTGINTFIIDTKFRNSAYARNVKMVRDNGIRFVSRIVLFPGGGTHAQVTNKSIWEKKLALAKYAVSLGASEIQMDYIRYSVKGNSSASKAHNVNRVIKYFRDNLPKNVKLQIDIFGEAAHKPSNTIGQNVVLFAPNLDAICPMVYPSHYEPFRYHATRPYNTVLKSVSALKQQIKGHNHLRVYAYIELYNYRYPMNRDKRMSYTRAQIQAAKDAGADGYYVWSAQNQYDILFNVLKN